MELATFFEGSDFQKESLEVVSNFTSGDEAGRVVAEWKGLNFVFHLIGLHTDPI